MSVSLRLADEIDVSRGDMLVHPSNFPRVADRFDANVVWMSERPLDPERSYLLKHTTQIVRAHVERVHGVTDPETLEPREASALALNDIGKLTLQTHKPLFHDAYADNRTTGAFILIDSITYDSVAAGMIEAGTASARVDRLGQVSPEERRIRLGQRGATIELALPSARDAQALAHLVERHLFDRDRIAAVTTAPAEVARAGVIAIAAEEGTPRAVIDGEPIALDPTRDHESIAAEIVETLRRRGTWDGQ